MTRELNSSGLAQSSSSPPVAGSWPRPPKGETVTVQLSGGLGNQMFQYAFGRAVAEKTGRSLVLDAEQGFLADRYARQMTLARFPTCARTPLAERAQIPFWVSAKPGILKIVARFQAATNWGSPRIHCEPALFAFDEGVFEPGRSRYFAGYWQNPRYFAGLEDELRGELTLPEPVANEYLQELLRQVEGSNSVAVHFRRYDRADLKLFGKIRADQRTLEPSYYEAAVASLSVRERNMRLFAFGDDSTDEPWLRKLSSWVRVDRAAINDDAVEQWLMSRCKHQIIANSTYSWWAAWLNPNPRKTVMAPRKWFESSVCNDGVFPPDWHVLD